MDTLEEQVEEERHLYLNEEEDRRMENSRKENWRDVAEDDEDKCKIHVLRWYVYTREKE